LDAAHDALKALTAKLNQCSASSASLGKILDVRRRLHNYDVRSTNIFFSLFFYSLVAHIYVCYRATWSIRTAGCCAKVLSKCSSRRRQLVLSLSLSCLSPLTSARWINRHGANVKKGPGMAAASGEAGSRLTRKPTGMTAIYLFLFNDLMLLTKAPTISRTTYKVIGQLEMHKAHLVDEGTCRVCCVRRVPTTV
jgi:hypothetical protein